MIDVPDTAQPLASAMFASDIGIRHENERIRSVVVALPSNRSRCSSTPWTLPYWTAFVQLQPHLQQPYGGLSMRLKTSLRV